MRKRPDGVGSLAVSSVHPAENGRRVLPEEPLLLARLRVDPGPQFLEYLQGAPESPAANAQWPSARTRPVTPILSRPVLQLGAIWSRIAIQPLLQLQFERLPPRNSARPTARMSLFGYRQHRNRRRSAAILAAWGAGINSRVRFGARRPLHAGDWRSIHESPLRPRRLTVVRASTASGTFPSASADRCLASDI